MDFEEPVPVLCSDPPEHASDQKRRGYPVKSYNASGAKGTGGLFINEKPFMTPIFVSKGVTCGAPGDRSSSLGCLDAQVAERLMAADCKSATHSSYGGSNPPLCTTI